MDSLTFATTLARHAGDLLCSQFNLAGARTTLKPDRSVVTEADLAADRYISSAIGEAYPGEAVLSEELRTTLPDGGAPVGGAPVWVVDPLDGTTNFSLGLPIWGVSIARLVGGWPDLAVVYFPLSGELYTAQRGQGARLNHQAIAVSLPNQEKTATFFSCCTRTHRGYRVNVPYKTRILGSAAYSLCLLARGAALLTFEATPKLWDIAGAWLVVTEAGGSVETYNGSKPFPARPGVDYSRLSFPTLGAATSELITKARGWILPSTETD